MRRRVEHVLLPQLISAAAEIMADHGHEVGRVLRKDVELCAIEACEGLDYKDTVTVNRRLVRVSNAILGGKSNRPIVVLIAVHLTLTEYLDSGALHCPPETALNSLCNHLNQLFQLTEIEFDMKAVETFRESIANVCKTNDLYRVPSHAGTG